MRIEWPFLVVGASGRQTNAPTQNKVKEIICFENPVFEGLMKTKEICFGVAYAFVITLSFGSAFSGAAAPESKEILESSSSESSGLSVVIKANKYNFDANEPLALIVTLRNATSSAFRLPTQINSIDWALHLENVATGMQYTGVTSLPGGVISPIPTVAPIPIGPNEVKSETVTFRTFGFVEGNQPYEIAKNALFTKLTDSRTGMSGPNGGRSQLPSGVYKLSVDVRFPNPYLDVRFRESGPVLPGLPNPYLEAQIANERDPLPLWKGDVLRSYSIQIAIMTK